MTGLTLKELSDLMDTIPVPHTYYAYPIGEVPDLPYFVFYYPGTDNFSADNVVYKQISSVRIELYANPKNFEAESKVEAVLDSAGIFWDKSETFISADHMFETIYEMEVVINGQ